MGGTTWVRSAAVIVAVSALFAGCSSGSDALLATGSSTTLAAASAPTTTSFEPHAYREFEVAGVQVLTIAETPDLPQQASEVSLLRQVFTPAGNDAVGVVCLTTIIDIGLEGATQAPCGGITVSGLGSEDWGRQEGGARFGIRGVRLAWPPVDGVATVLEEGQVPSPRYLDLAAFAPTPVTDREAFDQAWETMRSWDFSAGTKPSYVVTESTGEVDRVLVYVAVADRDTIARIAAAVDDPSVLLVVGRSVIHR